MKNLLLFTAFFCCTIFAFSQDKLILKNKTEILCKVAEVGVTEIKYHKLENPDGPLYAIKKSDVVKIVFANGTEELVTQSSLSVTSIKNRYYKRAVTLKPFAPLARYLSFGYQQAITPNRAYVGELGLIGPHIGSGISYSESNDQGAFLSFGMRFKRVPEVITEGMEWGYNLAGYYVQPEITFSAFNTKYDEYTYDYQTYKSTIIKRNYNLVSSAIIISLGRQMVFGDILTVDISSGLGYALSSKPPKGVNSEYNYRSDFYSHRVMGVNFPLAVKVGLSIGLMLK